MLRASLQATMTLTGFALCAQAPIRPTSPAPKPILKPGAGPVPATPGAPSTAAPAVDNSKPEPSAVYGYITVVDPGSGQRYLFPPGYPTTVNIGSGLSPMVRLVFRSTTAPGSTTALTLASFNCAYINPPAGSFFPIAAWYCFPLAMDSAVGDRPILNPVDKAVHYDPSRWRFLRIEIPEILRPAYNASTGARTPIPAPLSSCAPLDGFPDFAGALTGPRTPSPAR